QQELLQFKLQKVWVLVDLPSGKKAISTKWVFKNKKDERSIVVKNKARLVAQGFRQEEGIDYDEVFALVSRIEAIRLFLAFASYIGFPVYQMDVKSAFFYGIIKEEVYVHQPPGFIDPVLSTSQPLITLTTEPPHSPSPRPIDTEGNATTTSGLDAGLDSGHIHECPLMSHEAPLPKGNTSGSAGDSLQLKELMAIIPKLVTRIDSLEKELKETKQSLGNAVLTLVKKVKSLEVALNRKSKKVVLSDSEDEETENPGRNIQDIDDDPLVSLVKDYMEEKSADLVTPIKISASGEAQEEDIKANPGSARVNTCSTPVSTHSIVQKVNVIVSSPVKGQREGKAPMPTEDVQDTKRTKAQIQQEKADLGDAMRLQALQDEEAARQKRKAKVQEVAQYYIEEDWDTIRAKLEANTKLTKSLQGENVSSDDFAKRMVEMINQKKKYYAKQKARARRNKPMTQA
ncbi:putative ribonuclease H-like domain-containing protein, partial [Tanacetum coccineum]